MEPVNITDGDRQALLDKIRADMAASRKKIAEMKEKKARGTVVFQDSDNEAEKQSNTKKFEETTSLVEKLRKERAAKKAPLIKKVGIAGVGETKEQTTSIEKNDSQNNDSDGIVRIQKLSNEDTRQRSPSISKRFQPTVNKNISIGDGRRPSMDSRRPSIGGRIRQPSVDQGDTRRPSISDSRRPSIGGRGRQHGEQPRRTCLYFFYVYKHENPSSFSSDFFIFFIFNFSSYCVMEESISLLWLYQNSQNICNSKLKL